MGRVRFQIAVSLDGFVAGPHQSEENPLGVGGMVLHEWLFKLEGWRKQEGQEGGETNASTAVVEEAQSNVGATVMGRNMFGGGPGPWSEHALGRVGFVTEGIEAAPEQAKEAADGNDVMLGGGANAVQQYLSAGLVDEFELHIVPILLGDGERLLDNIGDLELDQVRVIEAPGVTHIKYRASDRHGRTPVAPERRSS